VNYGTACAIATDAPPSREERGRLGRLQGQVYGRLWIVKRSERVLALPRVSLAVTTRLLMPSERECVSNFVGESRKH
jgi:hypothetical protein